ncbi:collagen-binding protein [Flavobacterium suaedae]|uniref:Collagen-binding protein n=1 Tax=Flavobacterium suaedae TaxID=1767027 RepID=A0ABQ1JVS8_9FLAO|nr:outer membrane beta-barrel protein [Flavobacterium suaedae]GGB76536.1 collagen-binding protein [Flavobacterium suaedae]
MQKGFTLLVLLFTSFCFSQSVTLKGKITDPDDFPLESATIYLTSEQDSTSTVLEYTISDSNGNWEIKTRTKEEPVFLKASYMGFADYRQKLEKITEDRNFGAIKMADKSTELNEVVIEGEAPPIRIKSDTLEFNASSFKVRPDANVQTLLKQLPGVEIDSEGKITVNGKEVNQILVNGKPFFDKDGKVALQNLPAEIINKVQVTDTKTKKEELTGKSASGDNASINLTIDKDKNKGLFGKFMGGYGTDDRYESSAMLNYFKDKRRISILASSNNINSTGFTMDEIFDSMGGGRNYSVYTSSDGSFGINGIRFGGGNGITKSNMVGVNYADEWVEGLDSNVSYFFNQANTENDNRTKLITYLTNDGDANEERSILTESVSKTDNEKFAHNVNTTFEIEIDSTTNLYFYPKFSKLKTKSRDTSSQFSENQDGVLLNENSGSTYSENDTNNFENEIDFNKSFGKKGRYLSLRFQNENSRNDGANYNQSTTTFYNGDDENGDGIPDITTDNRNQVRYNRQISDIYNGELEYSEPITDSISINVSAGYKYEIGIDDRDGFNFDEATGNFTTRNDSLTNYLTSETNTFTPMMGLEIRKKDYTIGVSAGTDIVQFDNFGSYRGIDYTVNKDYVLPTARAHFRYSFSKSKSISLYYRYNIDYPQASQVLPIEDVSNALSTRTGNPDLDPNKRSYVYLSFRDFDFATRSGYNIYLGGNIYDSRIVSRTDINSSAKRVTSFTNVSDTYNMWAGGYWNKSIKREEHTYRINLGIGSSFNLDKGYTNGELYEANQISLTPRVNFTWEYGEALVINPSYRFSYNETHFTNYTIDQTSYFTHNVNLQTTSYWPKHVVFGNDFGYTYNSNLGDGFKKDFFLWNTSIGYNFLNDKLLFKVKVYDLLNQNLGTSRSITPTSVYDQQNTVLKRYVMFSLTFKLEKFGGKKEREGGSPFWWF